MPETAPAQVRRLIELIAWMSQRDTNTSIPYRVAAKHLGVSAATVRRDLDALVALSDEFKPWLASLTVGIVAEGRIPIHLVGEAVPRKADDRYAVVASLGGAPKHPVWYHNIVADPHVSLQDGAELRDYVAHVATGDEKREWWSKATEMWPDYDKYQASTDREIPLIVLEPVG